MKSYKIAVVPGDGIGNEIVPAGMKTIHAVAKAHGFDIEASHFNWGAGFYKDHGHFMPDDGLETLKAFDAVFFGAVGLPEVDDTLPFKLYTNYVRTRFNQYVNLRPVRTYPGVTRPLRNEKHIDFVVVRENSEGEFVQIGDQYLPDSEHGMGVDSSIFTRRGIERIAHYAFKLAQSRNKKLTQVTKSNTLINSLAYWDRVVEEVSAHYPDVEYGRMYIDAASANFVLRPEIFDVVLTTNLHGDILSDIGGAIMGSLGLGGSGNINPDNEFPSMFEPIHGSAPDIYGQGIANPYGQIWSGALMLEHLGEKEAADHLMQAVDKATAAGVLTIDLGGTASTNDVANAVIDHL